MQLILILDLQGLRRVDVLAEPEEEEEAVRGLEDGGKVDETLAGRRRVGNPSLRHMLLRLADERTGIDS